MKKLLFLFIGAFLITFAILLFVTPLKNTIQSPLVKTQWAVRSIDTMKYSRDQARQAESDPTFDATIDNQMADIAKTGANYVAIGTPYDEEFVPVLKRWVAAAHKYNLKVWFRGNFAGWEGWFEYPRINRQTHLIKVREFIVGHPELFTDGDIFTSCPECENGMKIEWGHHPDVQLHREFLIAEYHVTKDAFAEIGKNVTSNYFSMNGDLARAMMDKETTQALGGVVVIDHYVSTPQKLAEDVQSLAAQSGGTIILGEFGAPIPDIHGVMTEDAQKQWLDEAFALLTTIPELKGVNYWTNKGGSTQLWNDNGTPRSAVSIIKKYYLLNIPE